MQTFSARETLWLQELDGIELAGFRRRAFAFILDWIIVSIILSVVLAFTGLAYVGIQHLRGHSGSVLDVRTNSGYITLSDDAPKPATAKPKKLFNYQIGLPTKPAADPNETTAHKVLDEVVHILSDILVPVLYFGFFLWKGDGRTPGKRLMKIRVVSLVHTHITFWHAVERALGYGAAALEGGVGFIQFFFHPYRRCAQDRLAETIVVTERSYQQKFPATLGAPLDTDAVP